MENTFSLSALESGECDLDDPNLWKDFNAAMKAEMLSTRGAKFRFFFYCMEAAMAVGPRLLPQGKERSEFVKTYYAIMRYADDIVDGDHPLPAGCNSSVAFIEDVLAWNAADQKEEKPKLNSPIKKLLAQCYGKAAIFGEDFHTETADILRSLLFDAKRRGTSNRHSEEDLQTYFHELDISGTISGCLKVFGENPAFEKELTPLGQATRIFYNLRDLREDVDAGLINISSEDISRLHITSDDLETGIYSEKIQRWWREQTGIGLNLLKEHRAIMQTLPLKMMTKLVLSKAYEGPAEAFFTNQLEILNKGEKNISIRSTLKHPIRYGVVTVEAARLCYEYSRPLGITESEQQRFNKKVQNLSLLYSDFSNDINPRTSARAAKTGLLSAAYDVVTDWRKFDAESLQIFDGMLLQNFCTPEERQIALTLYKKDKTNTLCNDGLERGSLALQGIVSMMRLRDEWKQRKIDIPQTGEHLQIVDDFIDRKEDHMTGEKNCLETDNAEDHLYSLVNSRMLDKFPGDTLLRKTIERVRWDACLLLKDRQTLPHKI